MKLYGVIIENRKEMLEELTGVSAILTYLDDDGVTVEFFTGKAKWFEYIKVVN